MVALNKAGGDFLHTQNGGYLTPRGLMLVGAQDQSQQFDADCNELNMAQISVDEAIARVPILNPEQVGFAAVSEAAFDIDTDRLLQGLRQDHPAQRRDGFNQAQSYSHLQRHTLDRHRRSEF